MALNSIRLSLERNPNGVYTVTSPDVPGLVTEGSTASEIFYNVQDALEALKEAWQALGMEVPAALHPTPAIPPQTIDILVAV